MPPTKAVPTGNSDVNHRPANGPAGRKDDVPDQAPHSGFLDEGGSNAPPDDEGEDKFPEDEDTND